MVALEGVEPGLLRITRGKRFGAGRLHFPRFDQLLCALGIDRAPVAPRPARREAIGVAFFIDGFADTVDPTIAQRLINSFLPRDARPAGSFLVEAHPQLRGTG